MYNTACHKEMLTSFSFKKKNAVYICYIISIECFTLLSHTIILHFSYNIITWQLWNLKHDRDVRISLALPYLLHYTIRLVSKNDCISWRWAFASVLTYCFDPSFFNMFFFYGLISTLLLSNEVRLEYLYLWSFFQ